MKPAKQPLTPMTEAITLQDSKRLIALEETIERGKKSFVEVGAALAEIRDSKLYRVEHASFEAYLHDKWGWTKQHAYRLIECAPIAKSNLQVTSLNQARAAAKAPPEKRERVIRAAVAKAESEDRPMTANDVQTAVLEMCPTNLSEVQQTCNRDPAQAGSPDNELRTTAGTSLNSFDGAKSGETYPPVVESAGAAVAQPSPQPSISDDFKRKGRELEDITHQLQNWMACAGNATEKEKLCIRPVAAVLKAQAVALFEWSKKTP